VSPLSVEALKAGTARTWEPSGLDPEAPRERLIY
jgi:hypothetical protein